LVELRFEDHLVYHREKLLEKLISACYDCIRKLSSEEALDFFCEGESESCALHCANQSLGALLRGLRKLDLWPNCPEAQNVNTSVEELRASLLAIDISSPRDCIYAELDEEESECRIQRWYVDAIVSPNFEDKIPFCINQSCMEHSTPEDDNKEEVPVWTLYSQSKYGFQEQDFIDVSSENLDRFEQEKPLEEVGGHIALESDSGDDEYLEEDKTQDDQGSVNEYGNDAIDDSIGGHEGSTIEEEHDDELLEGLKSEGTNTMDDGADEYEAEEATGDDSDPFRYKEDEITRALESEHLDSQNRSENQGQERARE